MLNGPAPAPTASFGDEQARSTAAIILRRFGSRPPPGAPTDDDITYWSSIPKEALEFCQGELVNALLGEADGATRRKVCDTISELALELSTKQGQWFARF